MLSSFLPYYIDGIPPALASLGTLTGEVVLLLVVVSSLLQSPGPPASLAGRAGKAGPERLQVKDKDGFRRAQS